MNHPFACSCLPRCSKLVSLLIALIFVCSPLAVVYTDLTEFSSPHCEVSSASSIVPCFVNGETEAQRKVKVYSLGYTTNEQYSQELKSEPGTPIPSLIFFLQNIDVLCM